jgi:beta-lactamase superfamily II metal-dependent hydrolase
MVKIQSYLAIISAGYNNRYHHPAQSVLDILEKYNLEYKRTDKLGTIEVITDGKSTKLGNLSE